jgi:hypothetical protein
MKNWTFLLGIGVSFAFLPKVASAQELGPAPLANESDFVSVSSRSPRVVTVTPTDRAAVVQFYQTTYQASQGITSGWTGNRGTCAARTTSQAYADATILRVNYFRAMAGLPGDCLG